MNLESQTLKQAVRALERKIIREAIAQCGSRVAAARRLGITTQTLRQKLAGR